MGCLKAESLTVTDSGKGGWALNSCKMGGDRAIILLGTGGSAQNGSEETCS